MSIDGASMSAMKERTPQASPFLTSVWHSSASRAKVGAITPGTGASMPHQAIPS